MRFSRKFGLLKFSCCMVFANVTIAPCTDSDFHMTYNTFCDSGVHRSMGTHISKVRSIELDQHIWTVTLIEVCCLHGMYVKASNKCIIVMCIIMGVGNLCISRVSFLIVAVHNTVLFRNWYLFTYSSLAYSHFAYFKPNSGISPPLKK